MNRDRAQMTANHAPTWRQVLARTAEHVGSRPEALWMCRRASGTDATEFAGIIDSPVTERAGSHLGHLVARRLTGEPIQYVLGSWEFRRLELMVDARVLIPRPETEQLVERALEHLVDRGAGDRRRLAPARGAAGRGTVAVDLGTGSGAIGLSLLAESRDQTLIVWMTDASEPALAVARANAAGLGMRGGGARFALGSWWEALPGQLRGCVDLACANPPYIATGDCEITDDVTRWEPHGALFAGPDGLDALRTIIGEAPAWLAPGAMLLVEIGHRQGPDVASLFRSAGLADVAVIVDASGRDRFVSGRRGASGTQ